MMYQRTNQFYGDSDDYFKKPVGVGMMSRGFDGRVGIFGVASAITMFLVWILLILLICALAMHLRRMRKWEHYKVEKREEPKA